MTIDAFLLPKKKVIEFLPHWNIERSASNISHILFRIEI